MTQLPGTNTVEEEVAIALINFERGRHGLKPIKVKTIKRDHKNQWQEYIMKAQIAVGVANHYWGQKGL